MSKDKAGKKDKLKHLDLFEMMLNQSQVFRDMVEQFQRAWVPQTPSVGIDGGVTTRSPTKKQGKAAPVAKPAKKDAAKIPAASAKHAPTAVKPSAPKSTGNAKAAGKAVVARRSAREK
ncbi:MAG: hypothetical protein HIU89_15475 [Proteobacteria bacterium]|nr:hypothetical protein [Pseudomonadota bacterium]